MSWVIAGGGTGGHVTPALALGEVLRHGGEDVLFVGTKRGLERRLVPEAGFDLVTLDARPVIGRGPLERARAILALLVSTLRAFRLLRQHRARIVVSVGGYASVPAALAALLSRLPTVLVNVDAVPGTANRLLSRFADRICVGFPGAERAFARRERVRVTGVPLREALRRAFGEPQPAKEEGPPRLFVFGGSQGARQINEAMMAAAPDLASLGVQLVHQTGEADRERVEQAYRKAGLAAEVVAFERDMPRRYREAELVVCRAGAISVAELSLAGRPALLVPLAHVGGGEQFANAAELERVGAARVLDSRSLTDEAFRQALLELLGDRPRLRAMAAAAAGVGRADAAERVVAECRALLGEGGAS